MKQALLYMIRKIELNEAYTRQKLKMDFYCKQNNIQIIGEYTDIGYPAINIKRPALLELLKRVGYEDIDIVIFYGMESYDRDLSRLAYIERMMRRSVGRILYIHDSSIVEEISINSRESS